MNTSPFLLCLAVGFTLLTWGTSFSAVRLALAAFEPGSLALLRYGVGSLAFLIIAIWRRPALPAREEWPRLLLVAATGITIYNLLMNYGLVSVLAGPGAFINNAIPLFSALLAVLLLHERPSWVIWLGMSVSLTGVLLIAIGESNGRGISIGAILLLGSALSYAFYNVLQKPLLAQHGAFWVVAWAVWLGTAMLLPWAPRLVEDLGRAPAGAVTAVIYLGLLPTAVGFLLWSWALGRVAVSRLVPYMYFTPLLSLTTASLWLHERPSVLSLCGGGVVIGGVLLATRILARGPVVLAS